MIITTKQLTELFDPWPILLPRTKWEVRAVKPKQLRNFKCIWKLKEGFRVPIWVALNQMNAGQFHHQQHYVHAIQRSGHLPKAIIVYNGVVVDGTHHLLALLNSNSNQTILVAENLGKED
jgi:hypothetical protein